MGFFANSGAGQSGPAVAAAAAAVQGRAVPSEGLVTLAVLPFASEGNAGDKEVIILTFHDELLTRLSRMQSLRVIARTSVLEYQDTEKGKQEIGRELSADAILVGNVRSVSDRIQVAVQLFDAKTGDQVWAQLYDRKLSSVDISNVQAEIAVAVASAMEIKLSKQDVALMSTIPTANTAAYAAYLRAMDLRGTIDLGDEYRDALEQAVALDPGFTRAWAELTGAISLRVYFQPDAEAAARVEDILDRIHSEAPGSAEELIAQAYYSYYVLKDYDRAHQLIMQARTLIPSDIRLIELQSWIERRQGNFAAMAETLRQGCRLDPRNPRWVRSLNATLVIEHRYDEAQTEMENSGFRDAELAYWRAVLLIRKDRDIGRWVDDVVALQAEFPEAPMQEAVWDARIANREYAAAEALLGAMRPPGGESDDDLSAIDHMEIITYWFLGDGDRLARSLERTRRILDRSRGKGDGVIDRDAILTRALVAAAGGDTEQTEADIENWWRVIEHDQAERAYVRDRACRILGIAGATQAAVECIQTGLTEPSSVMPFLEPYLPYYDTMRAEPAFAGLLAEVSATNNL